VQEEGGGGGDGASGSPASTHVAQLTPLEAHCANLVPCSCFRKVFAAHPPQAVAAVVLAVPLVPNRQRDGKVARNVEGHRHHLGVAPLNRAHSLPSRKLGLFSGLGRRQAAKARGGARRMGRRGRQNRGALCRCCCCCAPIATACSCFWGCTTRCTRRAACKESPHYKLHTKKNAAVHVHCMRNQWACTQSEHGAFTTPK
jgi:hypothetical protein